MKKEWEKLELTDHKKWLGYRSLKEPTGVHKPSSQCLGQPSVEIRQQDVPGAVIGTKKLSKAEVVWLSNTEGDGLSKTEGEGLSLAADTARSITEDTKISLGLKLAETAELGNERERLCSIGHLGEERMGPPEDDLTVHLGEEKTGPPEDNLTGQLGEER